jgi:ATP-dependent helicase/nuclease subunit B
VYLEAIIKNSEYFRVDKLYPAGVFYFKIDDPLLESEVLQGDLTEDELLKKLKMDGLLLKDISIATAMDTDIESKRKSTIVPFELKKDDQISSRSKVADDIEFDALISYVKDLLSGIGSAISDGETRIEPIKSGQITGCMSCDYKSICQFDLNFGNDYKYLENLKDDDVLMKVTGKDDKDA